MSEPTLITMEFKDDDYHTVSETLAFWKEQTKLTRKMKIKNWIAYRRHRLNWWMFKNNLALLKIELHQPFAELIMDVDFKE